MEAAGIEPAARRLQQERSSYESSDTLAGPGTVPVQVLGPGEVLGDEAPVNPVAPQVMRSNSVFVGLGMAPRPLSRPGNRRDRTGVLGIEPAAAGLMSRSGTLGVQIHPTAGAGPPADPRRMERWPAPAYWHTPPQACLAP